MIHAWIHDSLPPKEVHRLLGAVLLVSGPGLLLAPYLHSHGPPPYTWVAGVMGLVAVFLGYKSLSPD
jgi:hypothetical protein